jgi:PAS domain S-box-containing protein/diguanylate cyclase (GGDEF)-like protein
VSFRPKVQEMRAIPDSPVSNIAFSVIEDLTDGVLTHDATGRVVQWNDAALRILGAGAGTLAAADSSNPLWQAVHADGSPWPLETQPAQLALHAGRPVRDETMGIHRPDGAFTWVRVNAYPVLDDFGAVEGATTIFNDITDILGRATSQVAAQRRFITAFDRTTVGNLIVSAEGEFLAANPALAMLFGRTVAELLAIDRFGLAEQGISMHLFNALTSPQRDGTNAASFEYRRPDGEVRYGLTQICAIEWPGSDQCSMVQIVDITELAQSRIELERSVDLFQATFESSPIGLMIIGLDGVVRRVNTAMGRLLGLPAEQVAGLTFDDIIHPEEISRVKQFVAKATSRSAVAVDFRVVRPDGEIRWLRTQVTQIDTDEGPALLGQAVDHTAERRRDILNQSIDPLTGLLTRERLVATLEDHAFSHAVSTEHPIAVLVADIVDFKGVNDRLGPEGADQVLRRVGATIRASVPADADVARIGPDVFAVAALGIDAAAVANAAALIDRRLSEVDPNNPTVGGPITMRIGAIVVTRLDSSPDDILQQAEAASRSVESQPTDETSDAPTASKGRRTPIVLSSDGTDASQSWSEAVERALEDRNFLALAEPLVALSACRPLRRFELLVRLELPDSRLLTLPQFDRLAKRMGYGPVIDRWMIDHALELLAQDHDLEIEVNIAPSSLSDPGFLGELAGRLETLGGTSERLILAFTERNALDDLTQAMRFSDEARALGVRIALDEYIAAQGGGAYLESLGVSRVKLSGRLIRVAAKGTSERQMIAELARTAHEYGVEVAAPFVSDPHMLEELRDLGVDLAQGRLIGPPVPSSQLLVADPS